MIEELLSLETLWLMFIPNGSCINTRWKRILVLLTMCKVLHSFGRLDHRLPVLNASATESDMLNQMDMAKVVF